MVADSEVDGQASPSYCKEVPPPRQSQAPIRPDGPWLSHIFWASEVYTNASVIPAAMGHYSFLRLRGDMIAKSWSMTRSLDAILREAWRMGGGGSCPFW